MKLTGKEKVSYGLGAVGKDMVYMFSASYVLYYYQDILGVSAIAMGIILMAARVFDAFNDPIMGVVVAKTRTKWGKFRPWLFIGTLTNAVILYLMFAAPPKLDGNGLVAYAAVTYILWGVTYTMMDIPYWSMIPAFTEGGKREGLSTLARSCAGVGSAIVTIITMKCVYMLGQGNERSRFQMVCAGGCNSVFCIYFNHLFKYQRKIYRGCGRHLRLDRCSVPVTERSGDDGRCDNRFDQLLDLHYIQSRHLFFQV